MPHALERIFLPEPRFLLLYSPLQFAPGETTKPDGSLSLAYLAGALRRAGYDVEILDCAVGGEHDSLEDSFYRATPLPRGLVRVGLSPEAIIKKASDFNVIAISSIFSPQTSMVLEVVRLLKREMPERPIIAGGVNARALRRRFFASGVDMIAMSEAEDTIVRIAEAFRGKENICSVPGVAFVDEQGRERVNLVGPIEKDLDRLPFPAWDLLPLSKYWEIARPHGGHFEPGKKVRYASVMTSRGCPFRCTFCHISMEQPGSETGNIARFRVKSVDRVLQELDTLKGLGVEHIFVEDDSLFAKKPRAYKLFKLIREMGLSLLDVNGVNICHLHKNSNRQLVVDEELLGILREAGFRFLTLPFESASQRVLDKYATSKWNVSRTNSAELIRAFDRNDIKVSGNYMIGYPDESVDEIYDTILMARRHVDEGLDYALFFTVVPFPGSRLFEDAIRTGQLDADFDPDELRWTKSVLRGLSMEPEALEHVRQLAWLTVNRPEYVSYKRRMLMDPPHQSEAAVGDEIVAEANLQ